MIEFFSRLNENKAGTDLPKNWLENISLLINDTYPELSQLEKSCQVWAELFDNELLIITSLRDIDTAAAPTTISISTDIEKNSDKELKKILDKSVETIGMIVESYLDNLAQADQVFEYNQEWEQEKKNKFSFYYKVTREDIELTLKANQLLNQ